MAKGSNQKNGEINPPDISGHEELLTHTRESLYAKKEENLPKHRERRHLHHEEYQAVPDEWEEGLDETELKEKKMPKKKEARASSGTKALLFLSFAFFIVALGIALASFFGGKNIISTDDVSLAIASPVSVEGGSDTLIEIKIKNGTAVPIQSADLLVEYPSGIRPPGALGDELAHLTEYIGDIAPGQEISVPVHISLFGEEGEKKSIRALLEFRVEGSNAVLVKELRYQITISASPLIVTVDMNSETLAGQKVDITLTVASNAQNILRNIVLEGGYPFGFTLLSSSRTPDFSNNIWHLGDLSPGDKIVIRLQGTIEGVTGGEKTFRFTAGAEDKNDRNAIGVGYSAVSRGIILKSPFIAARLTLNNQGDRLEYVVSSKDGARGDITVVNTLPSQVHNVEIEARLVGNIVDEQEINVANGFYRSTDKTIIWNKTTIKDLGVLESGGQANVSFLFPYTRLYEFGGSAITNPGMNIDITVRGTRTSEDGVPEEIESFVSKKIKINSDVTLLGSATYFTGPFKNFGPMPPRVGVETSYTITWTVFNPSNNVRNGIVRAALPPYMRFVGETTPFNEDITWNDVTDEVIWDLGNVRSGTGFSLPAREASFQVAILPSITQVNLSPTLIQKQILSGRDDFTGTDLTAAISELTTRLSNDIGFDRIMENVVE